MGHRNNSPRERVSTPSSRAAEAALGNLVIVTMETSDEANLGAICRAMKNFGVGRLCAVAPRCGDPKGIRARKLACNAEDLLQNMRVASSLEEAATQENIEFFAASTARRSSRRGPFLAPSEFSAEVLPLLAEGRQVGLLLGREDRGLLNEEVDRARWKVSIPTSAALPSLNLAQASIVMLASLWELAVRSPLDDDGALALKPAVAEESLFEPEMAEYNRSSPENKRRQAREPARADDLERLIADLEDLSGRIGYLWESNPAKSMRPFRQMAAKANLTRREVGIIKTLIRQARYRLDHPNPRDEEE